LTLHFDGDKDPKPTETVIKLTDTELELKDDKNDVAKFKKKT